MKALVALSFAGQVFGGRNSLRLHDSPPYLGYSEVTQRTIEDSNSWETGKDTIAKSAAIQLAGHRPKSHTTMHTERIEEIILTSSPVATSMSTTSSYDNSLDATRSTSAVAELNAYTSNPASSVGGTVAVQDSDLGGIRLLGTFVGLEASSTGKFYIGEGVSCDDVQASGAPFLPDGSLAAMDPWASKNWSSDASGLAQVNAQVYDLSLGGANPVAGRVVVVQNSTGASVACGVLASTSGQVVHMAAYPGYVGTYSALKGTLLVTNLEAAAAAGVQVAGTVGGLETSASGGIHVHDGFTCDDADGVGGHYWPTSTFAADPWCSSGADCATVWSSDATGAARVQVSVPSFSLETWNPVAYRAIVLHLSNGTRAGCGLTGQPQNAVAFLGYYPGYGWQDGATGKNVTGTVVVQNAAVSAAAAGSENYASAIDVVATIAGLQANASGGIHVHEGVSCAEASDVGGHYWPSTTFSADPWCSSDVGCATVWVSNERGVAEVRFSVDGFSLTATNPVANRAVVVHDSSGTRVGCGVLASTPGEVVQVAGYPDSSVDSSAYANTTGTLVVSNLKEGVMVRGTLGNTKANSTGVLQLKAGYSCVEAEALGADYSSGLSFNPWAEAKYTTDAVGTATVSVSVEGFNSADAKYRALEMRFLNPAEGNADVSAGCGTVGYAYTAVATLDTYPGYAGPLKVSGTIVITETDAGISVLGTVAGLETTTSGGIHVHEGVSCAEASDPGGHFYPGLAVDPWLDTAWASNANGAASVSFPMAHFAVGHGKTDQNVANRAVVVHDSSGTRVGCGVLASTPGEVVQVAGYPGYAGTYENMTGTMVVSTLAQGDGVSFAGTLANLEASTSGGLHVHDGFTVADAAGVGGHFYDAPFYAVDPWCSSGCASVWTSDASGASAIDFQMVNFSLGAAQPVDLHAMVIHLSDGTRAGAGLVSTAAASSFVASMGTASPTLSPSVVPSPVPTSSPTTMDYSKLAVSLTISSTATSTGASNEALKLVIAQSIFGVDDDTFESNIMDYSVSSNASSTVSYTWTVAFDVIASLSVVNELSTTKWAASVESSLTSTAFTTSATTATGMTLVATSATALDDRLRSVPSPAPSLATATSPSPTTPKPTAADTVQVAVGLNINSNSKLTSSLATTLKSTIATELGVTTSELKHYLYSYTESTAVRRRLMQSITTYDWDVSCTVEVSLASTGYASVEEFTEDVETGLNSPTFQANVATDLGVVVVSLSASSTPMNVPTTTPTSHPDGSNDISNGVQSASLASWAIALIACAGFLCMAGAVLASVVYIRRGGGGCFGGHWGKYRAEKGEDETNPLGVDYPPTFSGGSILAHHHDF